MPSAKAFNDTFRKATAGVPSDYGALGYGGVRGMLAGVRRPARTDADDGDRRHGGLKYDFYKGEQYYRKCDHQSVQSVLIIESKAEARMKNNTDVFKIVHTEARREAICAPARSWATRLRRAA